MRSAFLAAWLIVGPLIGAVWCIMPVITYADPISSTRVLARDGSLLYEIARPAEGLRTAVSLERMPDALLRAVVATEDKRFYDHAGVDRLAFLRALVSRLPVVSRLLQLTPSGGSTIEMQLVKNLAFLDAPRTPLHKLREMIAAEYWALTHDKRETLAMYLNTVPLGNGTNGVAAASERYFRKDISTLTLGESALLAGIINAPTRYDPYKRMSAALERRETVFARMGERTDEVPTIFAPKHAMEAPHFVFRVLDGLEPKLGDVRNGGYVIRTTLDPELQLAAEEIVSRRIGALQLRNVNDAAAIMIDARNGEILAYVGSADYWNAGISGQVDMVTAKRQPGSALKPFLVFDALRNGATAADVFADLPVRFDVEDGNSYYPRNFNTRYYGPVLLRDALGSSLNIPMVKLIEERGLHQFFATLARFGIVFPNPPEHYGRSVILGGAETTLHDVTRGYARLARYGREVETRDVLEVTDARGRVVYRPPEIRSERLYPLDGEIIEQAAALVADILSDDQARALAFGEANLMETGKRVAVKSGTTKDFKDNLAFAYTPDFALGVWVGNADGDPMHGVSGVTGSVPILHDLLMAKLTDTARVDWPDPGGMVTKEICLPSGLLATPECPKRRMERFVTGTEPTRADDWWRMQHGKLTLALPPEYADWARHSKYEQSGLAPMILSPLDGDRFIIDDRIPIALQSIPFTASAPGHGFVLNGKRLPATADTYLWQPQPGDYTLELMGTDEVIRFSVR